MDRKKREARYRWCLDNVRMKPPRFVSRYVVPEILRVQGFDDVHSNVRGSYLPQHIDILKNFFEYLDVEERESFLRPVDIDVLGFRSEDRTLVVCEVKTALLPSKLSKLIKTICIEERALQTLGEFLRYHLEWLDKAIDAYRNLKRSGLLEAQDKPSSVGELVKELFIACNYVEKRSMKVERIYVASIILGFNSYLIETVSRSLSNLADRVRRIVPKVEGYGIVSIGPARMIETNKLSVSTRFVYGSRNLWRRDMQSIEIELPPDARLRDCYNNCRLNNVCFRFLFPSIQ